MERHGDAARNPPELLADLQAQVAANQAGIVALQSLVEREGQTLVQRQMTLLQQDAARSVQRLLLRLRTPGISWCWMTAPVWWCR